MCGIAGIFDVSGNDRITIELDGMLNVQHHRGTDAVGARVELIAGGRLGLGHRRLAIIDLSPDASQPMHSECGRYSIIYNGEIYNFCELRVELEQKHKRVFRTNSDTEVVLQALVEWGPAAFSRFNGMWGIAFLDRQRAELCLCRDRFGVKPLYLFTRNGRLVFASEIKAVLVGADQTFPINDETVYRYLAFNSLDAAPGTFFKGITRLPQGHYLICRLQQTGPVLEDPVRYWDFTQEDLSLFDDEDTLAKHLHYLLQDAVSLRLRSDVPSGLLLSGGVDSSCIAALMMQSRSGPPPTALAMVSEVPEFSEESFIDIATRKIGIRTQKVRMRSDPAQALHLLSEITYYNDEPVGTFSNIAQYLLMAEARRTGIIVILSGQGADELLCGYRKYVGFYAQSLIRQGCYKEAVSMLIGFHRNGTVLNQFHLADAKRYFPRWLKKVPVQPFGPRLHAAAVSQEMGLGVGNINDRQRADLYEFSVPMLTHYEDRMSMANGCETRLPFLDYRIVNLLIQAPPKMKLAHGWTKYILRKAMAPLVPPEIIWRKDKQGFLNPERTWLANELRPDLNKLFHSDMLVYQTGLLDRKKLVSLYMNYCKHWQSYNRFSAKEIFYPLALEIWLKRFHSHLSG